MLKRCEGCGKFFGATSDDEVLCSTCSEGELTGLKHVSDPREQRFIVARNLVYENPDISPESLVKIMRDTGLDVGIKDIMDFVKEGRLTLKNADPNNFCEDCGKRILSGRKCPTCTKKFEETIKQAMKPQVQTDSVEEKRKKAMYSQE